MTSTTTTDRDGGSPAHPIAWFTDRAHAALDTLAETPAWSMPMTDKKHTLLELTRMVGRITELQLRVLASAENDDVGADDAASSTAAWHAHQTKTERRRSHELVRLAHELDTGFDPTRRALACGHVNEAQARVIVQAINALPDNIPETDRLRAETHLVGLAAENDAKALKVLGMHLLEVLSPDEADRLLEERLAAEEREAARKTWMKLFDNGDGTFSGRFQIPALHAAMLRKAVQALISPARVGPDGRKDDDGNQIPSPELMGQGFCELLERFPQDRLPKAGGVNATVVVNMTLEQMLGKLGAASLDVEGEISASEARRLACEARIIPVVLGGDSVVLDVGRARRLHSEYQRVAMGLRDGGCTAEGCDRPPGWCQAHHDEVTWAEGGGTSVKNGRLLCGWHHHRIHDPAYAATPLPTGKVRIRRRQ